MTKGDFIEANLTPPRETISDSELEAEAYRVAQADLPVFAELQNLVSQVMD